MAAQRTISLPVNPDVLVWARTRAGFGVEDVADKLGTAEDRVQEWESGEKGPTPRQARRLAKLYDRPFLEFFSRTIPDIPGVNLVPDFRLFSTPPTEAELRALRGIQQWAEEQRTNALSLIEDLGERPVVLSENLRFKVTDNAETAATIAREAMGFSREDQIGRPRADRDKIPSILRDRIEAMGVLVLKQSSLIKLRARGMCLFAAPMSVIIFGGEAPGAQAFTLAHEFGHVLISTSAISGGPVVDTPTTSPKRLIENWCNRFAAAFLMPAEWLAEIELRPDIPKSTFSTARLSKLADAFAVSRHAMLVRLVSLGYVDSAFYWKTMRPMFLREEAEFKSQGRSAYYGKRYVNSRGNLYTGLVIEAWGAGLITGHNAAEYMGIKNLAHLDDIRNERRN